MLSLSIGPKGSHVCDTNVIELVIAEVGGTKGGLEPDRRRGEDSARRAIPRRQSGGAMRTCGISISYPASGACSLRTPVLRWPRKPRVRPGSSGAQGQRTWEERSARQTRTLAEQTWDKARFTAMLADKLRRIRSRRRFGTVRNAGASSVQRLTAHESWGLHLLRHCEQEPTERPVVVQRLPLRC